MITVDIFCSDCEETLELGATISTNFRQLIQEHDEVCPEKDTDSEDEN